MSINEEKLYIDLKNKFNEYKKYIKKTKNIKESFWAEYTNFAAKIRELLKKIDDSECKIMLLLNDIEEIISKKAWDDKDSASCYLYNFGGDSYMHLAPDYSKIGDVYFESKFNKIDYKLAFLNYKKAAKQKDSHAQYRLGCCYENGLGVSKNTNEAIKWYKLSDKNKDNDATRALADLYLKINKPKLACEYLTKCYKQGDMQSAIKLAHYYMDGTNVKRDLAKAYEIALTVQKTKQYPKEVKALMDVLKKQDSFKSVKSKVKAKQAGTIMTGYKLLKAKKYKQAVQCFKQLSKHDNFEALAYLAYCYCYGLGVKKDIEVAIEYLEYANTKGIRWAARELGFLYLNGKLVDEDPQTGWGWISEYVFHDGTSEIKPDNWEHFAGLVAKLGYEFYSGENIEKNDFWAFKCDLFAAEHGIKYAYWNLALDYHHGYGATQDWSKAETWYQLAASEANEPEAWYEIGCYYEKNKWLGEQRAVYYFEKGVEAGSANCMFKLGYFYSNGLYFTRNYKRAAEYYKMGAEKGDSACMNNLGCLYDEGLGVPQSTTFAQYWFKKAAEAGNKIAENNYKNTEDYFKKLRRTW